MYADEKNRPIPKTLEKCVERGKIEKDMWKWSERVETIGSVLCGAIIVVGFTLSIILSVEQKSSSYYYSSKETSFNGMTFIISWGICGLIGFAQYAVFKIAALLLGAQASIVENSRINANIAMYKAAQAEEAKTE